MYFKQEHRIKCPAYHWLCRGLHDARTGRMVVRKENKEGRNVSFKTLWSNTRPCDKKRLFISSSGNDLFIAGANLFKLSEMFLATLASDTI
jgi:hypothetical protein